MIEGYQQLWKAIIRPPRAKYSNSDLGPIVCKYQGLKFQRTDIQLTNKLGLRLQCSHFQPYIRPTRVLPCVIYLHGNSSCRIQGRACIPYVLCHDITLFTFDFAGCGNSQGEYISLGYYQKDDVDVVFQYLRSLQTVSSIGLWGRSMGAVTALMYADKNPEIACLVCDSPFSNLQKLCKQLASRFAGGFISFFSGIALTFLSNTIKQKNNFDIASLDPLGKHVKKAYIPAFFIAAKDDNFIIPKHSQKLYEAYSGQKMIRIVEGDHNSQRDSQVNEVISSFFYNNMHVHQLVTRDQKYIKQQSEQRQNKKQKPHQKPTKAQLSKKPIIFTHQYLQQFQNDDQMLQLAIRLSLQHSKSQQKPQQQVQPRKSQLKTSSKNIKVQVAQKQQTDKKRQINNQQKQKNPSVILSQPPGQGDAHEENIDEEELDEHRGV